MEIIALLITVVLFFVFLWVATLFLRMGANWAGVPKAKNTIMRAALALFLSWLVIGMLGGAGSVVPVFGNILGLLVGIAINGLIVGMVYGESFGKGCQIYVLSIVAQIVVVTIAILILIFFGVIAA